MLPGSTAQRARRKEPRSLPFVRILQPFFPDLNPISHEISVGNTGRRGLFAGSATSRMRVDSYAPAIFREDGVCHGPSRWEETAASFSWVSFIDCFDLVPEYQPAHGTFPGASHGSRARRHVHGDGRGDDSCGTGQADGRQKGK